MFLFSNDTILKKGIAKNVLPIPQLNCDISAVGRKKKTKKKLDWGRSDADAGYDGRNHMRGEKETSAL